MSTVEFSLTSKGKPCLAVDGYQHRIVKKDDEKIFWICLKYEKSKCRGAVKTDLQNNIISRNEHTCLPNVAGVEIKKALQNCRKRVREETSVPVHKIFQEAMTPIYDMGLEFVTETPKYTNVKSTLTSERRKVLGTIENPKNSKDIVFDQNMLRLIDGNSFLRLDFQNRDGNRILVFGGEISENLLIKGKIFFFDGTFKSSPKQFYQLYTIHVDWGSSDSETNVHPVLFVFLPNKKETTYIDLLLQLKEYYLEWTPEMIKLDFEAAVINACEKILPNTRLSGCNFHFNQCLWRKIQSLGLTELYREDPEIRKVCRMFSALAYLPLEDVADAWLAIMSIAPKNEKLSEFIDYFVETWMENPNMDMELWNVHNQRHRTNNAVEGWNCKINRMVGRMKPNIHFLVKTLKDEAKMVSQLVQAKELGEPAEKRRKKYVKLDIRIKNILGEYENSKDLIKCLTALSYVTKMD